MTTSRRSLLLAAPVLAVPAGSLLAAPAKEPEVTPTEDLMREHGLLNRVLLVYEECARRLEAGQPAPQVRDAALIIRDFVERYHEELEEKHLFRRLAKGEHAQLVATLHAQHLAGRKLTAALLERADALALRKFVRMYRPHEAREDTVLFPAFRETLSDRELRKLGDQFEEQEHKLFGDKGFEGKVVEVAGLEKALGIYELGQFTP